MKGIRLPLWATVFTLAALAVLLSLGTWQAQRHHWKQDLLQQIERAYQQPDLPLSGFEDIAQAGALSRVQVRGRYDHESEILIQPRTWEGRPGYHVVTLLEINGGGRILVNRGWIPSGSREQAQRPETLTPGPVTVAGLLRLPEERNLFTPESPADSKIRFHIDTSLFADKNGALSDFILYADAETGTASLPVREALEWRPPDNHRGYAIFWYSLALTLLVIYYFRFLHRQVAKRNKE